MVDYLVNTLLHRFLGDFIESDMQVSMSLLSGEANLKDVYIKNDVFQKFGLPLKMVYGKISKLKLQVPYTSLSSKPVTAILDGVDIVVQPITNQAEWDLKNLVDVTDLTSIELAINNYLNKRYEELKKTKEELQEDAKMNVTYAEMIADNIKVVIQNVHIRVENCEEFADTAIALG